MTREYHFYGQIQSRRCHDRVVTCHVSMHDIESFALHELPQAKCRDEIRRSAERKMDLRMNCSALTACDGDVVCAGSKCVDEFQYVGLATAEI